MIYKRGKCKLAVDGRCVKCGRRGSCGEYWYRFMWQGKLVHSLQTAERQGRATDGVSAPDVVGEGHMGIRDKKSTPTLKEFINKRVDPWAQARFKENSPDTYVRWFGQDSERSAPSRSWRQGAWTS